jgi:hypothetical protein|tara:strand:- start:270 stop:521 length:252 start_codon:yes stop_codon:yes gene_type:complete
MDNFQIVAAFQDRLRGAIELSGMSRSQLARDTGECLAGIRFMLAGPENIRYHHGGIKLCRIIRLAKALRVDPGWLAFGEGDQR